MLLKTAKALTVVLALAGGYPSYASAAKFQPDRLDFEGLQLVGTGAEAIEHGFSACRFQGSAGYACEARVPIALLGVPAKVATVRFSYPIGMKEWDNITMRVATLTYHGVEMLFADTQYSPTCLAASKPPPPPRPIKCRIHDLGFDYLRERLRQEGWLVNERRTTAYVSPDLSVQVQLVDRLAMATISQVSPDERSALISLWAKSRPAHAP